MEELRQLLERQNEVFGALLDRVAAPQAEVQNPRSLQPVPQPPPLCLDGDMEQNFDFFKRNWENYASAIGMDQWPAEDEPKKVGYLLSVIGFEALRKYFNFQLTDEQRRAPVVALAAIKEKVVRPRNMNLDLLEFFSVKQELETIDEFHTKLKVLAKPCQLGELEERFITYKIVMANKWPHLRKRLTTNSEITLEKAVNECRLEEVSAKRIQELGCERSNEVNKIESKKERREQKQEKKCKFCGGRHVFEKGSCPAYGQKCRRCKKKNHFEKMCPNRKCEKREKKKIKEVLKDVDTSDSSESYETSATDESEYEREIGKVYNNASSGGHILADLHLKISGRWKTVKCELDTGANASLIGYNWLRKLYGENDPVLFPSKLKLQSFGGGAIPVIGEVKVPCRHKGEKYKLVLQVVDVDHRPLLSANVCYELGLVKFCNSVTYQQPSYSGDSDAWKVHRIEASRIVEKYADVFRGYGKLEGPVSLEIDPTVQPQIQQPRRIPIALREKLKEELQKLEKDGIIVKELCHTEWVSNILLVNRSSSGESFRICLDPIPLNKAIRRPNLQFNTLDEIMPELGRAKVFSTVDARKGFWQVVLDDASSLLTTFWTPFGRYRWVRLPFGISSAPEIFQLKLREVIGDLDGVECLADDLLIFGCGETLEEAIQDHNRCLEKLFSRLKQCNVKLNRSKLVLCRPSVRFFGHVLTDKGLQADESKISVIKNYPAPANRKDLMRFVGMVNYLSRFIPNLSANLHTLRKLISEKVQWTWSSVEQKEFDKIKTMVSDVKTLQYYDMKQPLWIECDASSFGLGVAVYQDNRIIGYASRTLSQTEKNYAQIEKELLAVLFACIRFDQIIIGNPRVVVKTDHKPLINVFQKPLLKAPKRLQHMLLNLQRYNIRLQFVSGKDNVLADAISRAPDMLQQDTVDYRKVNIYKIFGEVENIDLSSFLAISDDRINEIIEHTASDSALQTIIMYINHGWPEKVDQVAAPVKSFYKHRHELSTQCGLVFRGDRIVIPASLHRSLIESLHTSHTGIESTLRLARANVFWPRMSRQVKDRIQECSICAKFGASQQSPPMKSHAVPIHPFQLVSMDVFFQAYKGKQRNFLVTVDHYSDYYELDLLRDLTPGSVIDACKRNFACHGTPQLVITDNATNFVNEEMVQFAKLWGFKHSTSAPHHQQANGKAEAAVKIAKQLIRKASESGQDLWFVLQLWRNTPNNIGTSPASRLFSRSTRCGIPIPATNLMQKVVEGVPEAIMKNRQKIKYNYDKRARQLPELEIGSPVYVQARPQSSKVWSPGVISNKLSDRSYVVNVDGTNYRRDAVNVKSRKEPAAPFVPTGSSREEGSKSSTVPVNLYQTSSAELADEPVQTSNVAETESAANQSSNDVNIDSTPEKTLSSPKSRDRPKREIRLPAKYKDFIVSKM